jgi:hypothetical protein
MSLMLVKSVREKAVDRNGYPFFRTSQDVKGAFGAAWRLRP